MQATYSQEAETRPPPHALKGECEWVGEELVAVRRGEGETIEANERIRERDGTTVEKPRRRRRLGHGAYASAQHVLVT